MLVQVILGAGNFYMVSVRKYFLRNIAIIKSTKKAKVCLLSNVLYTFVIFKSSQK